tara:strand:- start:3915 stop:6218 length:2304 start_codon:yes stop_codon:yes gene_type:complete
MAKQKKKRNKKYKKYIQNYVTGDRVDMRNGGRVGYQIGKKVETPEEEGMSIQRQNNNAEAENNNLTTPPPASPIGAPATGTTFTPTKPEPIVTEVPETTTTTTTQAPAKTQEEFYAEYGDYTGPTRGAQAAQQKRDFNAAREQAYQNYLRQLANNQSVNVEAMNTGQGDPAREDRVFRTGQTAEQIARGQMEIPLIPTPATIGREGTDIATGTGQMDDQIEDVNRQDIQVGTEEVSTGQVTEAQTPQERGAAQITQDELTLVPEQAQVDTAQGQVSRDTTGVDVDRVGDLDSTQVQIEPGAVANRVVGVLSPEAKATAATNAGTSLSRITRAKKQLSRAGLSEEDIATIGNDPEALEDRLADFSEEERGVIAGLPEEALVSTQLNGLLEGMENGEIPVWARPAVASVEAMLARRGLSASSVGRDSLFNAIVQSAMPIAQSNAQAIQQSVSQQKTIEAQTAEANAQRMQQTALVNSSNVFKLNMAQFSADQQTELSNSKFLQTVSLTEASAEQQSIIQSAVLLSQANIAEANLNQQAQIQNAKNFLQMDLANLSAEQQSNMLRAQQTQQRLLSNQSALNAAAQFNAASENQTNQFMLNLQANMEQFNASQSNSMEQFNVSQENAAEARRVGNELQAESLEAQLALDAEKFNSKQEFVRDQFNAQQEMVIAQSNVEWRRKANTADTAAFNAVNQQNAQNAFSLTAAANNFLWQELRDEADFDFRRWDNDQQRKASLLIAALGNEQGVNRKDGWTQNLNSIGLLLEGWLD